MKLFLGGRKGREEVQDSDDDALTERRRGMVFLARAMVRHIANHEDPQALLAWATDLPPRAFPHLFDDPDPAVNARKSYWLARSVWNATPLASNGFRPQPLPTPKGGELCPCGSGDTYAGCCAIHRSSLEGHEAVDPVMLWHLLAAHHKDSYWLEAERSGKLSSEALSAVATYYRVAESWRPLQKLVEARLAVPKRCNDPLLAEPIECLCDAYEHLHRTPRKMLKVLKQFAEHRTPALRASANRRLSEHLLEAGEAEASRAAMEEALAAEPDTFDTALFELTWLARTGALERASERAVEWHERLKGAEDLPKGFRETIRAFEKDPQGTMESLLAAGAPEEILELLLWLDEHLDLRPPPRLHWRAIHADPEDDLLRGAYRLTTPRNHRALEKEWLTVSGMEKPFSTAPNSGIEMACWAQSAEWVNWLHAHPQALDSLTILDDLAMLLEAVEDELRSHRNRWYEGVLVRGVDALRKSWARIGAGHSPGPCA